MVALPKLALAGPDVGRGTPGQYVYCVVWSHQKPEAVERLGLETHADFTETTFKRFALECFASANVELVENVAFCANTATSFRT